eukprot:15365695-Ditylum_brightwellii.AAC.1
MEKQMKKLSMNMVKLRNKLKEAMKILVNKFTEAAVTKLTNKAQASMSTININVTALITVMREASRGLIYATAQSQTPEQTLQESQNSSNQQTYPSYAEP